MDEELRQDLKEMIVYLLPLDVKQDDDVIDNYINAFNLIFETHFKRSIRDELAMKMLIKLTSEILPQESDITEALHLSNLFITMREYEIPE